MSEYSTDKVLEFRKALNEIFTGQAGETVIEFLTASYIDASALAETPELTHYRLGQKELIQGLIKDAQQDIKELESLVRGDE